MGTLDAYRRNVYSQNGEDGVIAEINRRLGITAGAFVECGAWDGKHLSNTYLLLTQGWRGVHIEADPAKFRKLLETQRDYPDRLQAVQARIETEGANSLDSLLAGTGLRREFELLSIDIDSYDWHVWLSLQDYRPAVVLVETNNLIPPASNTPAGRAARRDRASRPW